MPIPVSIPRLGWNMEEGVFVGWLKADGEAVRSGDAVFTLEGEKATEEVESLDAGTLHIPADGPQPGDRLAVGAVIGYLLQAGEAAPTGGASAPGEPPGSPRPVEEASAPVGLIPVARQEVAYQESAPAITPRARRLAARLGVAPTTLKGTGRNGRVRERDVAPTQPLAASHTRRAIAARMVESHQTTAPVTLTSQVDATNLVNLREQFKAVANGEPVPSYTDFLVKFVAVALQKHPLLASRWADAGIVPAASLDIGVAVDTDAGLLVPAIRDVPALGLREIAARSRELIDRARRGALSARDMGGCFTITNLGAFGIDAFTPIINVPECAILGVGRIERRPVMDGDRVVGRELVTLSLTFDHRIVDGAPAARFLQALAACVENPAPWVSS